MNATTKRAAPRKIASKKPTLTAQQKAYLESLPPKLQKLHLLCMPLRGKFTKALSLKKW